ncbi:MULTISPECIES: hypothetical protein [unclassified Flavobacterium]|uniref:hypothetical protein n=1 Tax=unclassified Flavobacterium TaxID=196869 RepID=UPI0025C57E89|nr:MULTISPECIES: hypothetical protein [unclassified Flavobacterium]
MSKKLRKEPIFIAPDIFGWIDEQYNPHIFDDVNKVELNAYNAFDKITIYERQVKEWFLNPAIKLLKYNNRNKGFIVLMICLSYIEGVEQFKVGSSSDGRSKLFFRNSMNRIYPNMFNDNQLNNFYSQARCGLFHNGMVQGKIVINNSFERSIEFLDYTDIKISPSKFLKDIILDFENYIAELKNNEISRNNFSNMYSNI